MTKDDVIRLADICGLMDYFEIDGDSVGVLMLESFAKLVAAKAAANEREACAKVAFVYDAQPWSHEPAYAHVADMVSVEIGKAIRARGQA